MSGFDGKYKVHSLLIISSPNVAFYNKTTCLLRRGCFSRDISVVTPV